MDPVVQRRGEESWGMEEEGQEGESEGKEGGEGGEREKGREEVWEGERKESYIINNVQKSFMSSSVT